jgi:hypothetical protein
MGLNARPPAASQPGHVHARAEQKRLERALHGTILEAVPVEAIVDQFIADLLADLPVTTTTSTSTTSSSSPPSTNNCGGSGVCSVGSCGSNGEVCQTVPSCVCGGPIFCICSATTFTTCTMPICSTTSTLP